MPDDSGYPAGTSRAILTVGETEWGGWTELEIVRSIERVAGAFALAVTERWPGGQTEKRAIRPGMACSLAVDGETLITGWIDDVEPAYNAEKHQLIVRGRDRTGDLFDCAAWRRPFEMGGLRLDQIATQLCEPFGVPVRAVVDMGQRFDRFAIQPGETVFEAIERGCRQRAVLPMPDGLGGLLLTRAGEGGEAASPLRLGGDDGNIKGGTTTWSVKDLFSDYVAMGSAAAPSAIGLPFGPNPDRPEGAAVAPSARVRDPSVTRYRPTIIMAEMQGSSLTLQQRAEWQRAVAVGKSVRGTRIVQDWRAGKKLWQPNTLTRVTDEWSNLDNTEMLIVATRMTLTIPDGTLTELTLALPDAYRLIPARELGGSGSAHDPFRAFDIS